MLGIWSESQYWTGSKFRSSNQVSTREISKECWLSVIPTCFSAFLVQLLSLVQLSLTSPLYSGNCLSAPHFRFSLPAVCLFLPDTSVREAAGEAGKPHLSEVREVICMGNSAKGLNCFCIILNSHMQKGNTVLKILFYMCLCPIDSKIIPCLFLLDFCLEN